MPNKLIIDKSPFYTRCAILSDGVLQEIHIMPQNEKSIEGNIFIGKVESVSKGIDAAFVNIGQKNNAFLFVGEKAEKKLKQGESIIVQALRDASKGKGVYITTNISFAGTYTVVFPDGKSKHVGVSMKITDKAERKRLIDLVRPYVPDNCSVVLRTGAEEHGEEIVADLLSVIDKMQKVLKHSDYVKPPALIYEEESFPEKIIRDTLCYDLKEITVSDEELMEKLRPLAESLSIELTVHRESLMIFDYYSVESKIKELLNKKVWLKSGAFLIIDEAEALVSIDVNTGKSKKRESAGETLYFSNIEAAREIPRQLRLRNLSGIVVVDFIDMKSDEKRDEVISILREECMKDRNKTVVVGFTELGLALLTRKKTREPLSRILLADCGCIGGRRYSAEYIAFEIYMKMRKKIIYNNQREFTITAPGDVLNELERSLAELEQIYGAQITMAEQTVVRGAYKVT